MSLLRPKLWSLVSLAILSLIPDINGVPIKSSISKDYIEQVIEAQADECVLPGDLDFSGRIRHLEDCPSLNRYQIPIPFQSYGNAPRVCCAKELGPDPICFPSDPWCPTYEEYEYEDLYDEYDYSQLPPLYISDASRVCNDIPNTECVPLNSCGNITDPEVEKFCGFGTDQIRVCCQQDHILKNPAPKIRKPRFLNSGKPYPCQDKHPLCQRWASNGACDLDKTFKTGSLSEDPEIKSVNMFNFMNLACQESCGWCGAKGCVDEISECEVFAREGYCAKDTYFMGHTCRESCGLCGYLSPENTEEQTMGTNSYSNIEDSSFDCGRYKALDELKNAGIQIQQDQFPNKTELDEQGECSSSDYPTGIDLPVETDDVDKTETADADNYGLRDIYEDDDDLDDTSLGNTATEAQITCGLIIISDRWMLSAAHCYDLFYSTGNIRVSQVRAYLPEFKEYVLQRRVFVHPNYKSPQLYNDIALVELGKRIIFNYDVLGDTPTCLSSSFDFDEKIAAVTGWGKTEEGEGSAGKKLGTVNITLTNYETCNQNLTSYVQEKTNKKDAFCTAMPYGILDQNICGRGSPLCSLGEKVYPGSCKGDSGGPVEVQIDGKRTLVGLVSGSINCNSPMPEWFTRVAYFREWILCIIDNAKGNRLSKTQIEKKCKKFASKTEGVKSSYCN